MAMDHHGVHEGVFLAGFLEGEDACTSDDDFTVDFDDRGMGGNPSDGTDWGTADDVLKCGVSNLDNTTIT